MVTLNGAADGVIEHTSPAAVAAAMTFCAAIDTTSPESDAIEKGWREMFLCFFPNYGAHRFRNRNSTKKKRGL